MSWCKNDFCRHRENAWKTFFINSYYYGWFLFWLETTKKKVENVGFVILIHPYKHMNFLNMI